MTLFNKFKALWLFAIATFSLKPFDRQKLPSSFLPKDPPMYYIYTHIARILNIAKNDIESPFRNKALNCTITVDGVMYTWDGNGFIWKEHQGLTLSPDDKQFEASLIDAVFNPSELPFDKAVTKDGRIWDKKQAKLSPLPETIKWAEQQALSIGKSLTTNTELRDTILIGLERNEQKEGFKVCPCKVKPKVTSGAVEVLKDISCVCKEMKDTGKCHCGLFVDICNNPTTDLEGNPLKPVDEFMKDLQLQKLSTSSLYELMEDVPGTGLVKGESVRFLYAMDTDRVMVCSTDGSRGGHVKLSQLVEKDQED